MDELEAAELIVKYYDIQPRQYDNQQYKEHSQRTDMMLEISEHRDYIELVRCRQIRLPVDQKKKKGV